MGSPHGLIPTLGLWFDWFLGNRTRHPGEVIDSRSNPPLLPCPLRRQRIASSPRCTALSFLGVEVPRHRVFPAGRRDFRALTGFGLPFKCRAVLCYSAEERRLLMADGQSWCSETQRDRGRHRETQRERERQSACGQELVVEPARIQGIEKSAPTVCTRITPRTSQRGRPTPTGRTH